MLRLWSDWEQVIIWFREQGETILQSKIFDWGEIFSKNLLKLWRKHFKNQSWIVRVVWSTGPQSTQSTRPPLTFSSSSVELILKSQIKSRLEARNGDTANSQAAEEIAPVRYWLTHWPLLTRITISTYKWYFEFIVSMFSKGGDAVGQEEKLLPASFSLPEAPGVMIIFMLMLVIDQCSTFNLSGQQLGQEYQVVG